jgi:hypothetical protein
MHTCPSTRHEATLGTEIRATVIRNLGIRCRWMVSFKASRPPPHPPTESHQSPSGHWRSSLPPARNGTTILRSPSLQHSPHTDRAHQLKEVRSGSMYWIETVTDLKPCDNIFFTAPLISESLHNHTFRLMWAIGRLTKGGCITMYNELMQYTVPNVLYTRECSWPAQRGQSAWTLPTTISETHRDPVKKRKSATARPSFHWSPFVFSLITNLKSYLYAALPHRTP